MLFLLNRDLGPLDSGAHPTEPGGWLRLTDPEAGSSFHSFQGERLLGSLVAEALPPISGLLDERCGQLPLEAGTEVRLYRKPGSRERGCRVVPLPERCRYLLGMPVSVNRARPEELEMLPGVGPALAGRIVQARDSIGRFSSPEDLLRVPGVGRKLLERVRDRIGFQ